MYKHAYAYNMSACACCMMPMIIIGSEICAQLHNRFVAARYPRIICRNNMYLNKVHK